MKNIIRNIFFLYVLFPTLILAQNIGIQPTAVIAISFTDYAPDRTIADINQNVSLMNAYYQENSENQISFSSQTYGWYNLAIPATCNKSTLRSAAIAAADSDIYFPSIRRIIIVFAVPSSLCPYNGISDFGIQNNISSNDGLFNASFSYIPAYQMTNSTYVLPHEMGHQFALYHSGMLRCPSGQSWGVVGLSGCTVDELGDLYSIMGGAQYYGHFPTPQKEQLGVLYPAEILEVTQPGNYTLVPTEGAGVGLKTLKIRRAINDWIYIEMRRPIGFDNNISQITGTDVFQGVLLHTLLPGNSSRPLLLDAHGFSNAFQPSLTLNNTYTDPAMGATIQLTALNTNTATLAIAPQSPDLQAPTGSLSTPAAGATLTGIISITGSANDNIHVAAMQYWQQPTDFSLGEILIATTNDPFTATWDTRLIPNKQYYLWAIAYDSVGNSTQIGFRTVTVSNPPDTTPPNVTIVSPTGGTVPKNTNIFINVSATDNVAVQTVQAAVNGANVCYMTTSPYICQWHVPNQPKKTYLLQATAVDFAGNVGTSQPVTITSK